MGAGQVATQRRIAQLLLAALLATGPALAAPDGPRIAGPAETVYDWATERCAAWDIPDTPARAWRAQDATVRLVAGAEESRSASGPSLDRLAHGCAVHYRGTRDDDPGAYDDRAWIHATWSPDGVRVTALAHVEYHGELRPGRCASARAADCWRNAIVELVSTDAGESFAPIGPAAALPYRYSAQDGRRAGYFNPSNVLRRGDDLYAFVWAEGFRAQRRGACLLRRPAAGGPADWRAWDGRAFAVRFADPYREDVAEPGRHVCAPVGGIASTVSSVVLHTPSGRYLAVTPAARRAPDGREVSGIWWMTSDDLLAWSEPALLRRAPLLWRRDCAAPAAYAYPSLLDPASPSRNFETVGEAFWLYLVEMPLGPDCRVGPERDLIRLPVSWPGP
jgi:hypothetical protein